MITGRHSTAKIDGTNIRGVQKSTSTGRVNELDGQTAEDEGYEHPYAGSKSMSIDLFLVVDILSGDLTTLQEGETIVNLGIFTHIDDANPVRLIPEFLILECRLESEVQGRVTYSASGKSVGPYTNADPGS